MSPFQVVISAPIIKIDFLYNSCLMAEHKKTGAEAPVLDLNCN